MNLLNKNEPFLRFRTIHQIQGRIRVGSQAIKYLYGYEKQIEEKLLEAPYIESAKVTSITGNVLVEYDSTTAGHDSVFNKIESVVSFYSIPAFKRLRKEESRLTVNERRLQEEPVGSLLRNVLIGTGTLIWSMIKGTRPGNTIFGKLFNFTGMSAISLSMPIFKSGIESLRYNKKPNADTLSSVAIIASLLSGNGISALTIILLADIAELMTAYSMNRTRKEIRNMLSTGEKLVWKIKDDDTIVKVPHTEIIEGDKILVHSGEIISADGYIIKGEGLVDESSITGEFLPKEKKINDKVFAGSTVKVGTLSIYAEKTQESTAAAKIIRMVEEASQHKASVQTIADKFSAQMIPLNFILAGLVYMITRSPMRALNMLVIDYSCGIRLSTATSFSAAITTGARNKVLIKGSNYLEVLAETDTVIFDKTGTLTEGNPEVKSIIPTIDNLDSEDILRLAAAAEETSTHPVAHAILEKVRQEGIRIPEHDEINITVARGVSTTVDDEVVHVGNTEFMRSNGIEIENARNAITKLMYRGESIVYVAKGDSLCGLIGINDPLRENMKKSLNRLRNLEIDDIILLTGDVEQQAQTVASQMMFDRFKSELLPEDKVKFALNMQSKGSKIIMIGDGINDAPALAYADVGIALGSKRTDLAMEASDITIQSNNPLTIPSVIRLSRNTMSIVKQNFAASIGINSIALILGAMGVLPVFWGAFLHNMTTVAVVSNSLRLLFFKMDN